VVLTVGGGLLVGATHLVVSGVALVVGATHLVVLLVVGGGLLVVGGGLRVVLSSTGA